MMITTLLMVPLQEQHSLMYNSGKTRRQRRNSDSGPALYSGDSLTLCDLRESPLKNKQTYKMKDTFASSCLFQHDTVQRKRKQKPHCLLQPEWIQCCWWWVRLCCNELQMDKEKRGGYRTLDCAWMLHYIELPWGRKHTHTDHLLPLASLRSRRGNELSGIDCQRLHYRVFVTPLPGRKSICHLQFMVCFLHVWISYQMSVTCALSRSEEGLSCLCVRVWEISCAEHTKSQGGGRYLCKR